MRALTLAAFGAILAFAAFHNGGTALPAWHYCATAIGLTGALYFTVRAIRRTRPVAINGPVLALLACTVAVPVFQVIPLPAGVLGILSPSSLDVYQAAAQAGSGGGRFPISVVPSATIDAGLTLIACIVVFAVLTDLGASRRPWQPLAAPILAVATLEAILGLLQAGAGTKPQGVSGTYLNHNHFAGLLELAAPLAAMLAASGWDRARNRERGDGMPAVEASVGLGAALIMLLAVAASLSRMGFVATLAGLLSSGLALAFTRGKTTRAWIPVAAGACAGILAAALLPSARLIQRFSAVASGDLPADARFAVWRDTLHLARAYPVFGCGLGAFQSANQRFQTATPLETVNFAHNDYLQLLAELGVLGFLALLGAAFLVYRQLFKNLLSRRESYLYAACLGSLIAISVHSFADFNLYKPANAMVVAWIAAVASGRGAARELPVE